jgi:dGTPase
MTNRRQEWSETMRGNPAPGGVVFAHRDRPRSEIKSLVVRREDREAIEDETLAIGATRAAGAGKRAAEEQADPMRTCFERDRDRILHSTAFRRLAGKTQVFVFPADHERTRLTHALEVAQVATSIARAVGLNVALTEAIALGHDCGHGPGGHASEDAFDHFVPGGYHHAVWGADVVLTPLNLCEETLDGVRNHSWSRPTPSSPEGVVVSWADRCAYSAHDLEDAIRAGIVTPDHLPDSVTETLGRTRSSQLRSLIGALVTCISTTGVIGMDSEHAAALADLRTFNYDRVYNRPWSTAQGEAVIKVLQALVEHFALSPEYLVDAVPNESDPVRAAVAYVAGMTDQFAFDTAVRKLNWPKDQLPKGIKGR